MIFLIGAALLALAAAWLINVLIGAMMGERPGGLLSDWLDIFSGLGRDRFSGAEPLPDMLKPPRFSQGDQIQMPLIPLELERNLSPERRELFRRCAGKVLRVEGIDEFGALELHVSDDGSQSPGGFQYHILFIEPQYVKPAPVNISR